ncbi:MAG: O-antigen ligase domain-containing protein, partial [Candidatus Electrothrix sp. EH2]|nr:O-antigen ligase domain-containing protein [Candidatus Electrothrix sp. EH2]
FLPLLLLLSWIWLQVISLPPPLVRILAPDIFHAYQAILDLPGLNDSDTWIPLTVNPKATLLEGLRLSSYIFFYVLTIQLLTCGRRLLITVKAVGGLAVFIAFLSLIQRITAPDTLLWVRSLSDGKTAFGPWVYKNHYAGFMVMLCPLVLSQFLLRRPVLDRTGTCREKFLAFFSEDGVAAYFFWGFGTVVILASVFLTQSRGGILSLSFGLLLFIVLTRQRRKTGILSLLILAGAFFIIVGWYSWEPILERFSRIFESGTGTIKDDRLLIWTDSLKIIADFPLTGSGFGTFIDIFPAYKTLPDNLLYDHAHNDFLELLADGGLIAGGAALCFIVSVLKTGYKQIRFRKDTRAVLLAVGAFSGLAGLLVYSIFDFNLHNGANGLYFAFFCALLISAGHTRQYYQSTPTLLLPLLLPAPLGRYMSYIKGAAFLTLLIFFC